MVTHEERRDQIFRIIWFWGQRPRGGDPDAVWYVVVHPKGEDPWDLSFAGMGTLGPDTQYDFLPRGKTAWRWAQAQFGAPERRDPSFGETEQLSSGPRHIWPSFTNLSDVEALELLARLLDEGFDPQRYDPT